MNRPWFKSISLFIVVALLASIYPGYRAFNSWSAENLAYSAEALLEQGKVTEALEALAAAIEKDPDNYAVLRTHAAILTRMGHGD